MGAGQDGRAEPGDAISPDGASSEGDSLGGSDGGAQDSRWGTSSSPYATGGGGVTFAHRVAAVYLAAMLTGARRAETGGRRIRRVSFQTGRAHAVDDLLVECNDADSGGEIGGETGTGDGRLTWAIACRATPSFVVSHQPTVDLMASLLDEVGRFDDDRHRVAIAAAGHNNQWDQVATLCRVARRHADVRSFEDSILAQRRWTRQVRSRWEQLRLIVSKAADLGASSDQGRALAWRLLTRMEVVGFEVQAENQRDRLASADSLDNVVASSTNGLRLQERLEVAAADFDAVGAVVDRHVLRRTVHPLLDPASARSRQAWSVLRDHERVAATSVRNQIGGLKSEQAPFSLPMDTQRTEMRKAFARAAGEVSAVVVVGDSGTGKSACALTVARELAHQETDFEAVVVNLRSLPSTSTELRAALGMPTESVLAEMSAPRRLLVIDAADTAEERSSELLTALLLAAHRADVGVAAITSTAASSLVSDQVALAFGRRVETITVDSLDDSDLADVAAHFPALRSVLSDLPAASLFRRLVVLDLLVRGDMPLTPALNEWDCLQLIWSRTVRAEGRGGSGSPEAREQTLLALACASLGLPARSWGSARVDPVSVDMLRRDQLLAPASAYQRNPEFAHDEVRRYATAIVLLQSPDIVGLLDEAGAPRWAMSAAVLACTAALLRTGTQPAEKFADLLAGFERLGDQPGRKRWADVPVEAALDTPFGYDCVSGIVRHTGSPLSHAPVLATLVRVAQQRPRLHGLTDPAAAQCVAQVLMDDDAPWRVSKESFTVLADWLIALTMASVPAGHVLRLQLRARVLAYWQDLYTRSSGDPGLIAGDGDRNSSRPVRVHLDPELRRAELVETIALLGHDIDDDIEQCLNVIAAAAPAFLAPAVDAPSSARALAARDPELLASLMEAYYVDERPDGFDLDFGVRAHQGRWKGPFPPFHEYHYGGFWQLFHAAAPETSARVLNAILNHSARVRVRSVAGLRSIHAQPDDGWDAALHAADGLGPQLQITGEPRTYAGDGQVWHWYRGNGVGPNAGISALLAMERVVDEWLADGTAPETIVKVLLADCDNLAVPGLLYGILVRHAERASDNIDRFLAEPWVWHLEFLRVTNEYSGLSANTPELHHVERRGWNPRNLCAWLITQAERLERLEQLGSVATKLVEEGDRIGIEPDLTRDWAACLQADQYEVVEVDGHHYLQVKVSPALREAHAQQEASQRRTQAILRLQNRYWISRAPETGHDPATPEETAADLSVARQFLEGKPNDLDELALRPLDAVAHVVRTAVQHAVHGHRAALGEEGAFAVELILGVALGFENMPDQRGEGQFFDLGADRAIAPALPALLLPALDEARALAGASLDHARQAGLAVAGRAPLETRLYLARGCDVVWRSPCGDSTCRHSIALGWMIETLRSAELGTWDNDHQTMSHPRIEGDVVARLAELPGGSVDISVLDAPIRGLGAAAAADHCCRDRASDLLHTVLAVQRRAMLAHTDKGWSADDRGTHTLVSARALLQNFAVTNDPRSVLQHADGLRPHANLLTNLLHGIAAAGAESDSSSTAAQRLWPTLMRHALGYASAKPNPYLDDHWGDWAAAALLPDPVTWTQHIYNEVEGAPRDWVSAGTITGMLDEWIPLGRGHIMCVDALIRIVRTLPMDDQITRGIEPPRVQWRLGSAICRVAEGSLVR